MDISLFKPSDEQKQKNIDLKQRKEFREKFYHLMYQTGTENKSWKTFRMYLDEKTDYGYKGRLFLVPGLSFAKLDEKKIILQENLQCMWSMDTIHYSEFAALTIMTKPLDPYREFEPPKIKPYEMYLGVNFDFQPIIINCNKNNHFLFSGATGAGKTSWSNASLCTWVHGCSPNEIELYIADLAKDEFCQYSDIAHVRYYANDVDQLYKIMVRIRLKIEKRLKAISELRKQGKATNITEFNEYALKNHLAIMTYCYILIDEFSAIIIKKSDRDTDKSKKQYILDTIEYISKTSRSTGIFIINGTQKTVKDEIPSIIKNMAAVRVCFRTNDDITSQVIMGNNSACGLQERYAVYSLNGGGNQKYLFSPYITTDRIEKLLKPHIVRNKVMNIDSHVFSESFEVQKSKVTKVVSREVKPKQQIIEKESKYEYH